MHRQPILPLILLTALFAGCGTDQADRQDSSTAALPTGQPHDGGAGTAIDVDLEGKEHFVVDPSASEVYWTISKAGVMARFGHNHVISAEQFTGTVALDRDNLAASRFELEIPVGDLVVDDPELRSRLGEDFESVPSEEDKAGTRRNMLSEQLLKGDQYSLLRVRGGGPEASGAARTLPVEIEIVGQTFTFDLPGDITVSDDHIEASGEFKLEHSDLGLTPFSALGGALQVGPTIEFSYRIRAVPAE